MVEKCKIGSVIALLNNIGDVVEAYSYDPFGNPRVHTSAGLDGVWLTDDDTTAINPVSAYGNRIMFTAREYDNESGLYYYRARMYHPVLGRFMSPEPVIMHLLRVWAAAVYIFVFFCFAVEQLVNSNKFLESTFPFKSLVISFVLNAATLAAAVLIINFMHRLIIRNENN